MKIVLPIILILGFFLLVSVTVLSKNKPLLEDGFAEIITFVFTGKEQPKQASESITINPIRTIYTRTYEVLKRTGNESLYDISLEPKQVLTDSYLDNETKETINIYRKDTVICLKAGFDSKEIITYKEPVCIKTEKQSVCVESEKICVDQRSVCLEYANDNVTCIDLWEPCAEWGMNCIKEEMQDVCIEYSQEIESSYTYTVPNNLDFYKEKSLSKQADLTNLRPELSVVSPLNPNKFCYQANPEKDFYLKFGENSIIIIQSKNVVGDSLLDDITAESGDANFTHLTIDNSTDVYLEFDGDGDYVNITTPVTFGDTVWKGQSNFTLSAWINTKTVSCPAIIYVDQVFSLYMDGSEADNFFAWGWRCSWGGHFVFFTLTADWTNTVDLKTGNDMPTGWIHAALVYNGTNATIYVNGNNEAETGVNESDFPTDSLFRVRIGNSLDGFIDSVRIYNVSLNQANITEIYNSRRVANSSLYDGGNLVGWWKMDEAAGAIAADSSGEGNDGTLYGDIKWSTWALGDNLVGYWNFDGDNVNSEGNTSYDFSKENNDGNMTGDAVVNSSNCMYGDCLQLDGAGDYVDCGTDSSILPDIFTLTMWVKTTDDSDRVFSFGDYPYFSASYAAQDVSIYYVNTSGGTYNYIKWHHSPVDIDDGDWHHLALVINGSAQGDTGGAKLYADGQLQTVESFQTVAPVSPKTEVYIGNNYKGTIDEVMIFNTSLTAAQILDIYNNQSARFVKEGTQKVRAVNLTDSTNWDNAGYNRVNLTTTYETNMQSNISARIGQMNLSVNNSGLVLYMPFEWGNAVDISGKENDGTLVDNTYFNETGGLNSTGGFEFDGAGDYVEVLNAGSMYNNSEGTVSLWMRPNFASDDAGTYHIMSKQYTADEEWQFGFANKHLYAGFQNDSWYRAIASDPDEISWNAGDWVHLAWTWDVSSGFITIYDDGVFTDDLSGGFIVPNFPDNEIMPIGGYLDSSESFSSGFKGTIDQVMIFSKALSATEISTLYTKSASKYHEAYYTDYQNLTGDDEFNISTEADFIFPDFKFWAGNQSHPFYTPLLLGDITVETWNFTEEVEDTTAPTVSLIAPGNNSYWDIDNTPDFNYSAYDAVGVINCSRFINDTFNSSVASNANFTNVPVGNGSYEWFVNCSDAAGNWGYSGFFNLIINFSGVVTCDCPPSGNWLIDDGSICKPTADCNIGTNKLRITDGGLIIDSGINVRAGGCFVKDGERLYIEDGGGLFCGS